MRFNAPAASQRYAELADVILPTKAAGSDEAKTDALIQHLEAMIVETAIPRTLREVGVTQNDIGRMASDAMLQTRLLVNNPREVTEADAFAIYSAAL
jgi:alcohol dehydrogenase class IV